MDTKPCAACGEPMARRPRERPSDFAERLTCCKDCAYRRRAQVNRTVMKARAIVGLPAHMANDDRYGLPLDEAARVVALPEARQRRHWDTATDNERRLFAPDLRAALGAGA